MVPLRILVSALVFAVLISRTEGAAERNYDVLEFGAVGDGVTLNTLCLQRAIDTCAESGGGSVVIPTGRFLTGTLQLKDGVTLRLEDKAVLLGSTRAADYRNLDPFTDGTGAPLGYALVVAVDAHRVGLEGRGTIDGQGAAVKAAQTPYAVRPFLVRWVRCSDIAVSGIRLQSAGAWSMHFFQSKNVAVTTTTIRSHGLANNDGIDIDSCENVTVRDCDIDTGDDAICLKTTSAVPCRDVTVSGCRLTSDCATIKLGTESLGDFEKIRITNCDVLAARLGGIKLFSVDGAHLRDVTISEVTMNHVTVAVMARLGARLKTFRPGEISRPPGSFENVLIRNLRARDTRQVGILISGIPGHPIEGLTLDNIHLQLAGGGKPEDSAIRLPEKEGAYPEIKMFGPTIPTHGVYARHARGLRLLELKIELETPDARPAELFDDVVGEIVDEHRTSPIGVSIDRR